MKRQLAAHAAAREALPGTTDGQVYRAAQSKLLTLRALGTGYWNQMQDLLDGEFGRGKKEFAAKSVFGYERRLRGGGASRKKRVGEQPPPGGDQPAASDTGDAASKNGQTAVNETKPNGASAAKAEVPTS